ncbi:RNA polymerase I enhancer binding protein [Lignoscripta atroalba]|nr:RNA polymerase I enhancer binding protein [Lignoscripta atroalba]
MAKSKRKRQPQTAVMGQISSQPAASVAETDNTSINGSKSAELQVKPRKRKRRQSTQPESEMDHEEPDMKRKPAKRKRKSGIFEGHPSVDPIIGIPIDTSMGKKPRHKKQKEPNPAERGNEEAESALALMKLRSIGGNEDVEIVDEDDLAASAQLIAESSPMRFSQSRPFQDSCTAPTKKRTHGGNGKGPTKRRDMLDTHNQTPPVGSLRAGNEEEFGLPSAQHSMSNHLPTPSAEKPELPKTTHSLDDIDSDDENIATYLQEYQDGLENGKLAGENPVGKTQDIRQQLAVAAVAFEDAGASAVRSTDELSKPLRQSGHASRSNKRRKEAVVPLWSANGAGKLPFVPASDEHYYSSLDYDFGLTDYCGLLVDDELPIDPELSNEGHPFSQVENYKHGVQENLETPQHANSGQLKRVAPRSLLQKRLDRSGQNSFVYHTTEDRISSIEQEASQDHVLPGIEDLQRRASQDLGGTTTPTMKRKKRRLPLAASPTPPSQDRSWAGISKQSQKPPKNYDPPLTQIAQNGGMFTSSERDTIFRFRDAYCAENELTEQQFADRIHTSARNVPALNTFWTDMRDLLPYRTRQSIQKYCRRQFHNYAKRGSWTKEEDAMLRRAVELKGTSWKAVGEICERMAEDCRDRYRNYLYNSEKRNKEEWTDAETRALCRAVSECIWLMREEKKRIREEQYYGRDEPLEEKEEVAEEAETKLINWQIVCDKMGGRRSRLQCSYKWKRLQGEVREKYLKQIREAKKDVQALENGDIRESTNQWRLKKARKKVANMLPGDKYDILQALFHCGTSEEGNIPWKSLGADGSFRKTWSTVDCKVAWAMMKEEVDGADQMHYLDVVNKLLTRLMAEDAARLDERWEPEAGPSQWKPQAGRKKNDPEKPKPKRKAKKPTLSDELVIEESEVDEHEREEGMVDGDQGGLQMVDDGDSDTTTDDGSAIYDRRAKEATEGEGSDVDGRLARQLQLLRDA